ncbi:MAG: hypothetical protein BTN85_1809 [Candidatus Methanohalarchaeum thermophilum]|uniref:AMMECR1 domain-containing protein n=1 Tax=Methanohalarchaeum thermophilum TaxID=1903181 RepID=A0A1Q6DS54_METT1|nr:MAG: hypothetical protein BTN85_1809 [Candidatus Methanohalarchaeum thermophilum]
MFKENRGVFVTLHKNGDLFGCIGRPYPDQTLEDAVKQSALGAAFNDPRFPPLKESDLGNVTIEVTILTKPQEINEDSKDIEDKVKIGEDGLIIEKGNKKGLLLPQVPVEQGWSEVEFLSNTCTKAGIKPDAWLDEDVEIYKFQGSIFTEKTPNGEIVERNIDESS